MIKKCKNCYKNVKWLLIARIYVKNYTMFLANNLWTINVWSFIMKKSVSKLTKERETVLTKIYRYRR